MDTTYDEALAEVGDEGYFQKKFDLLYNIILAAIWCMAYVNIFLALVVPSHHCSIPENVNNVSDYEWKLKYIPRANVSGEQVISSCLVYVNPVESNETRECNEFVYDTTWYKSTVASENNWVCDKETYVANVFGYIGISEVIGSIVFGWLGDAYGRRLCYILSLIIIIAGRAISSLGGHSYFIFVFGCFVAAFPSWSLVQSCTVISMEISSAERRSSTATYRYGAMSIGICMMALIYWWVREWKLYFILTTVPLIPYLFLVWQMIESPRWLWIKGKSNECIKILKRIAKSNKTKLNTDTEERLLTTTPVNTQTLGPLALFSSWSLSINTVLQLLLWISVSISYRVLLIISGETADGNPFLEFAWQALVEIPGNFLGQLLADNLGRRYAGISSCGATAVVWSLISYRESHLSAWTKSWWIGIMLRTICRISNVTTYYTISLLNMELYPTSLRQSGMSLGNVFASGAAAVAPFILIFSRNISNVLPGVILTGVCILGAISSCLLPETLNTKLPETLEDAQRFGERSGRRYVPIFVKRSDKLSVIETKL